MPFEPRDQEDVYESLRDRLTGRIQKLTNFIQGSFNDVWVSAFSEEIHDNEVEALAAQLSGWIDYSGGPLTDADLERLGVDNVSAEEVNEHMDDDDLDELVKLLGVSRDTGSPAIGEIEVRTATGTDVTIPEGTEFGTEPDSLGNYLSFYTTEHIENNPNHYITIPVESEGFGEIYNVGAGQITHMPNPPTGVQAVTNHEEVVGGVDPETNEDLRARAKDAVFASSGGGTNTGIVGYVQDNTRAQNVFLDEFTDEQPPYVDVIVDGGEDENVEQAIEDSRPTGIRHNFLRPDTYMISIDMRLSGGAYEIERVRSDVIRYFNNLGIGQDVYRDRIIQTILNADNEVDHITNLYVYVDGEQHEYNDDRGEYPLDKDASEVEEVWHTFSGDRVYFDEGNDYTVEGNSISWTSNGSIPISGSFFVTYRVDNDIEMSQREKAIAGTIDVIQ